jgi:hypothetical protein
LYYNIVETWYIKRDYVIFVYTLQLFGIMRNRAHSVTVNRDRFTYSNGSGYKA